MTGIDQGSAGVEVTIRTPDGSHGLSADHVIACDGARSRIRALLDRAFEGGVFEERFLIADVEMEADFPSGQWLWFAPTFHGGQSALLQRQADNHYPYRAATRHGGPTPSGRRRPKGSSPGSRGGWGPISTSTGSASMPSSAGG